MAKVSGVADYFVLLTGTSSVHLRAVGKRIHDDLAASGEKPIHVDGDRNSGWIVYDYGDVIVHAMLEDSRRFYDLERLWGDAPHLQWKDEKAGAAPA